ncbi:microtubule associated protein-domain-containing protein [Suillus occidentalis]|nr:microtubule associated protein-domain-containing protein [Suillus occidentalis]
MWIQRSIVLGKLQLEQYYSPDPTMIFSGIVACATDLSPSDLEVLSAGITSLGGQWRTGLTRVAGSLSDLKAENVLPRRYESATVYQEKLRQIYHTKLEQLTTLTNRLNALARTLGSHFFHQDILTPAVAASEELDSPTALKDVMPERFSKLEKELVRGKGEVLKRLNKLGEVFTQIDWLYSELGIDPPPPTTTTPVATSSSTLAVPKYSLPRSSSAGSTRLNSSADPFASSTIGPLTPTPSSIGKSDNHMLCPSSSPPQPPTALAEVPEFPNEREYLRSLGRYIELLDSSPQDSPPGPILNSCGIEPTQGILAWAGGLHAKLNELKRRREVHIQAMYDQLEALWRRMGVDEDAMDGFVEANRGTTPPVVQAYEEELERMIDLKRERMGEFIANARIEIESLWEELLVGEVERNDFAAFADDEHTEDLLSQHEQSQTDTSFITKDLSSEVAKFKPSTDALSPVEITNVKPIASYSWIETATPTIAVPGSPRVWFTGPQRVPADSGTRFVDQNAFYMRKMSPLVPIFAAIDVDDMDPSFDYKQFDIITDRNNLRKLLHWVSGSLDEKDFRIDVNVAGWTCLFTRLCIMKVCHDAVGLGPSNM